MLTWMILCVLMVYFCVPQSIVVNPNHGMTPDDIITATFHRPLLEIVYPRNGDVIHTESMQVEIESNDYVLPSKFRMAEICLGTIATKGGKGRVNTRMVEQCFDQRTGKTFSIHGLVPGASYLLRVLVVDRGNIVAVSVRNFRVSGIMVENVEMSIQSALVTAVSLQQSKATMRAASIYHSILEEFPTHQDALHLLGMSLFEVGNAEDAIPYVQQAITTNASFEEFHNTLGLCFRAVGKVNEAVGHFERAVMMRDSFLEARFNLGLSLQQLRQWDKATDLYERVVQDSFQSERELKTIHQKNSIALEAQIRRCDLLQGMNLWSVALECLETGVSRFPNNIQLLQERASVLLRLGKLSKSLVDFTVAANKGYADARINVAIIHAVLGNVNKSSHHYQLALDGIKAHGSPYGHVLIMKATTLPRILPSTAEKVTRAIQLYENRLDQLLPIIGKHAVQTEPVSISFSLGFYLAFYNTNNKAVKTKLARIYELYCPSLRNGNFLARDHVILQNQAPTIQHSEYQYASVVKKRLRIGFVSRFFYHHIVGRLVLELVLGIDAEEFEVFVFSILPLPNDGLSNKLKDDVEHFVPLTSNLRVSQRKILDSNVDVLIYPELSTDPVAYFLAFARLAPVQAVWWGHADTTGIPNIDYYLSTEYEVPHASEHYSETLYRMEGMGIYYGGAAYTDDETSPQETRLKLSKQFIIPVHFHLYLSAQPLINMHPDFDKALAKILLADSLGHIFLLASSPRKHWIDQLRVRFHRNIGNNARRIHFIIDYSDADTLSVISAADVMLDAIHTSAPLSSLQAFYRGIPVITLPGELWRTRITYGFYLQMNYLECVATSVSHFAHLALSAVLDKKFQFQARSHIQETAQAALFHQKQALQEWQQFFEFAVDQLEL